VAPLPPLNKEETARDRRNQCRPPQYDRQRDVPGRGEARQPRGL